MIPKFNVLGMCVKSDYRSKNCDHMHKMPLLPRKLGTSSRDLCRRDGVRGSGGKSYGDDSPMTDFTGQVNSAPMFFNNFVCQRQTQSCAFGFCGPKGGKHFIKLGGGNTHAAILENHLHIRGVEVQSHCRSLWGIVRCPTVARWSEIKQRFWDRATEEHQLPTRRHRFNGVQDDVGKTTVELLSISQHRR